MTEPRRSQLEWLAHDLDIMRPLLEGSDVFPRLSDTSDNPTHALRLVAADLTWQIWTHVVGASVLLQRRLRAPLIVVQRACFEGIISLSYLVSRSNAKEEAQIFLAHSFLREIQTFSDESEFVGERRRNLANIPSSLVTVAERRLSNRPHTWSGQTFKRMAELGHVAGYDDGYRYMCGEAHVSVIGGHVRVLDREDGGVRIMTGAECPDSEVEAHANFARRNLHSAFRLLWQAVEAGPVQVPTEDPADWLAGPNAV